MNSGLSVLTPKYTRGFNCKPDAKNPKIYVLADDPLNIDYPMAKQIAGRSCRDGDYSELTIIYSCKPGKTFVPTAKYFSQITHSYPGSFNVCSVMFLAYRIVKKRGYSLTDDDNGPSWLACYRDGLINWAKMSTADFWSAKDRQKHRAAIRDQHVAEFPNNQ